MRSFFTNTTPVILSCGVTQKSSPLLPNFRHLAFAHFPWLVCIVLFTERDMNNPIVKKEIMNYKSKKVPDLELDEGYLKEARDHRYLQLQGPWIRRLP